MLSYTKTEITNLKSEIFEQFQLSVFVKREDKNHPQVSGNKWWKLKNNLLQARIEGFDTILTFGGAYSNHIFATAAAAKELNLKSIGIIRGEQSSASNHTLSFAKASGMRLHFISREDYRKKTEEEFLHQLKEKFGNFYLIPEGGTNNLAVEGVAEFAQKLKLEIDFDYICLPVGTAGTMAGIIEGLRGERNVIGIPVLKGAEFIQTEVSKFTAYKNWRLSYDYHFGGYGKISESLKNFIINFEREHDIPLDPVYTGKLFYGAFDMIQKGFFQNQSRILLLHTGGLQGRAGFNF